MDLKTRIIIFAYLKNLKAPIQTHFLKHYPDMRIECQGHYEKTVKYAESIGDETLNKCIERLKQWEANSNGRCEIELYYDSSPYSFGFAEVAKDGTRGVVGGLLYHGKPDRSFAVMIGGPFHGWSIHT